MTPQPSRRSPNIEFSASNLAQSSPSPTSLNYGSSPLNASEENCSGNSSGHAFSGELL